MKTWSFLIAWNDNDAEEGEYGATVRAESVEVAEIKARELMARDDQSSDPDDLDVEPREYGRVIDCHEGAIWKASELEAALRRIDARLKGEWYDPTGDLESDIAGVLRPVLAEIDGIDAA